MNLNPNQPEETIDEALLDEALGAATPDELEAKILLLTDPQMLSLLDEALAPEPASDALTQRILATMSDSGQRASDVGVLARIGSSPWRYAAAAAIALAVGLGVWFANEGPVDPNNELAINTGTPSIVDDNATNADPAWLTDEQYASNTDFFGNATEPIQSTLDNLTQSIDDVSISRETLWAELDAYEVFLDEIES